MIAADLALSGGTVVTMDSKRQIIEDGLVLILGSDIVFVGRRSTAPSYQAKRTIDATDHWVIPGLIDAHGHAGHSLVKTMGDQPGGNWLKVAEKVYFQYATEDFWYAEARLAGLERLRFGVTTGYSMLGNIPRADDPTWAIHHAKGMQTIGIRDILGLGPGPPPWPKPVQIWHGGEPVSSSFSWETAVAVTEAVCERITRGEFGDRISIHVSPSQIGNPAGLGDDTLQRQTEAVMRLAQTYDVMINAHAYGGGIAYAYEHLDILGPRTVLAHCAGISAEEVAYLAETDTRVVHCPSARALVRQGWCPVINLLDAGATVAIGTDGSGPDRTFCLFKDLRIATIIHRLHEQNDAIFPPGKLLEMITVDAARALGVEQHLGALEVGKRADVVLVDARKAHQYPPVMPVHRLVYETSGQDVSTVIVDGEILLLEGVAVGIDESAVLSEAQAEFTAMLERSGFEDLLSESPHVWGSR